jgi:hypothetical protein
VLRALEATGRILVVAPARPRPLERSARNLPTVDVILADSLNVVDLINADLVLIEQPALAAGPGRRRCPRDRADRPEVILRPVISEKSINESEPRQVHVRRSTTTPTRSRSRRPWRSCTRRTR